MRAIGWAHLRFVGLKRRWHRKTLNQLRHLSADHMRAKQLPGFGIEDGFNEPLGLAKCDGFAIGQKWKPADADLAAFLLGGLLGQADARYLRQAIGAAGNGIAAEWVDIVQD